MSGGKFGQLGAIHGVSVSEDWDGRAGACRAHVCAISMAGEKGDSSQGTSPDGAFMESLFWSDVIPRAGKNRRDGPGVLHSRPSS